MSYCLNPVCPAPQNADDAEVCQCGAKLRLSDRYLAIRSIGQGGVGRTFLAVDLAKPGKPRCVIKQFFPNLGIDRPKANHSLLLSIEAAKRSTPTMKLELPPLILIQNLIRVERLFRAKSNN